MIPTLTTGQLTQKDCEFEARLGYIKRAYLMKRIMDIITAPLLPIDSMGEMEKMIILFLKKNKNNFLFLVSRWWITSLVNAKYQL
jgi:hypothetical protein